MDVAEIMTVFDDHGFDDQTTQRKLDVINDVYWDILTREPWPFLEKTADIVGAPTVSSVGDITEPADFGNLLDLFDITTGARLSFWRYDDFLENFGSNLTASGDPVLYYFIGNSVRCYPTLTTHTLRLRYIQRPNELLATDLEAVLLLPKYWHSLIWTGGLAQLYDLVDDPEEAVKFESRFEKKFENMRQAVWKRQFDSPEFIHFIDEYGRRPF